MNFRRKHSLTTGRLQDIVLAALFVTFTTAAHQAFAQPHLVTVEGQEYRETVKLQGATVHGFQVTDIRAKLGGFVKSIGSLNGQDVDIGSRVKQGEILAVLDIPEMKNLLVEKKAMVTQAKSEVAQADAAILEAEAAVIQSRAQLEQVRSQTAEKTAMLKLNEKKLNRLIGLASSGAIDQDAIDEATFEVAVAKARLNSVKADIRAANAKTQAVQATVRKTQADRKSADARVAVSESSVNRLKTMMNYTVITAPYDGVITRRMIDLGSYVKPAENNSAAMLVFQLTQVSRVRIVVAVPNNKIELIELGQTVLFDSIGGLQGTAFRGQVTRVAGALDAKTRTMPIEVHLDNPAVDDLSGKTVELKPGLYGSLTIIRRDWTGDSLLPVVPASAVARDPDGNNYVTLMKDGTPIRRNVKIAFNDAVTVGISSGLSIGDRVMKSVAKR
ncbi:MAG: efflux RND transporter periplasmic adaptor subunit [Fuerstiella sp.]|nr:efflux RND transporter periplasmic adaptor subunit [Fuerstiella sp.]